MVLSLEESVVNNSRNFKGANSSSHKKCALMKLICLIDKIN
ncbi:hypothetical protein A6A12_2042 [Vibrio anguillarum]|nr:hypothetical protein A6A12_2042 [Vibrio anguillarum]